MLRDKAIFKQVSMAFSMILIGGLLASCGASKEELALKANCDKIFSNLQEIGERPEIFKNSDVADGESIALLLGEETRNEVERKILTKFPFLDDIIVGKEKDNQQIDLYYYAGSIFIIAAALEGTDIEFPYTREQMLDIATQENGWNDVVDPLAKKIFGDYMEPTEYPGCVVVDQAREEENPDDYLSNFETSTEFARASSDYLDFAEFLQAIRNCKVSGWHEMNKCAKVDFVSKPSTYTPSDELTEEEKEILAERERDAQSDSQGSSGSSGTSNVTPLQLCSSLGAVVQTENYGQLTCKLVWLNKIRTLVWMR
jgi:hypothetical protein